MSDHTTNQTSFSISYDGEGTLYEKHQISAIELAEIITAMNSLIVDSNKILNKKKSKELDSIPLLTVSAPVKEGSIIIDFIMNLPNVTDMIDVAKVLGFTFCGIYSSGSLLELIKQHGNKKPKSIIIDENTNEAIIEDSSGNQYKTSIEASRLINSGKIRESVQKVIYNPAKKPNTVISIIDNDGNLVDTIDHNQAIFYKAESELEKPSESNLNTTIKFVKINLLGEDGWTFHFAAKDKQIHSVKIEDTDFLSKVQNADVKFDTTVLFEVNLKIIEEVTSSGRKSKKYIIKDVIRQFG